MVYVGEFNDAIKSAEGANFSWAFYLATIGSVLAVVAAILVGIGNKPLPQQSGGTTFNMAPVTTSYPATVTTVQGGYYPGQQPYGAAPPQKAGYPS
nr:hypothetical protein BaRGS_005850 [Batillaria attramentaria]